MTLNRSLTALRDSLNWGDLRPETSTRNLVILAGAFAVLIYLLQGNVGFSIADEGYLWYGTIRVLAGEVPLRDFQSYDPGRYYWGALWLKLLRNDGILALRISQVAFEFIGLTVAFLLLRRLQRNWLGFIALGFILWLWMFPTFKIFEPVITILAVFFAVRLIEKPSKQRHFAAGVFVGLAAFFGRNHGVYNCIAFLLVIFFVWWKNDRRDLWKRLAFWSAGILVGYSPMLLMALLVPGFFNAVVATIITNVRTGTNLHLPVPWPWTPNYSALTFRPKIHKFAIGCLYILVPGFYLLVLLWSIFKSRVIESPLLLACALVGIGCLHYVFDRAQFYYLVWTAPPFLLGLISLSSLVAPRLRRRFTVGIWSFILVLSWAAVDTPYQNYFLIKVKSAINEKVVKRLRLNFNAADMPDEYSQLFSTDVRGDKLWVIPYDSNIIKNVGAINDKSIPRDESILIAPYWTSLYPILRKQSPTWEIYYLAPQPQDKQQEMISDLERHHTNWALVCHSFEDGRPELAFEHTHSFVWEYLVANFQRVPADGLLPDCELRHRTNSEGPASAAQSASPLR